MRVTFPRLPDHEAAYAVVERDDGVVYRLYGGRAGPALPHDIRHLVTERALGIGDGIWGGIAAGVPWAQDRHTRHADMLEDLVERVAALEDPSAERIRSLPLALSLKATRADPEAVVRAARALRVEAARWARLRVGESLSYEWPAPVPRPRAG
jgi:hypothetical protein